MVGAEIVRQAGKSGIDCTGLSHHELDITNKEDVVSALRSASPEIVINAAAYTAVDKAEADQARAFLVNVKGAENVASAATAVGAGIVHISTDYVFDGETNEAYRPSDRPNPINVYGQSKLDGEAAVQSACLKHVIIRTAWVYSHEGHNFVRTMLRLGVAGQSVKVVDDQHGSPTAASDLAVALLKTAHVMLERPISGTFHFTNAGVTTWYGFANTIFEMSGSSDVAVSPISTAEYPTPAKRPSWSVLDSSTFEKEFAVTPRTWRAALRDTLNQMQ